MTTLYRVMRCASGCCDEHPSSHNGGYNHCLDCNEDEPVYSHGISIKYVSCGGAKCRCSLDQWDTTPLYCIECYGPEAQDEALQEIVNQTNE